MREATTRSDEPAVGYLDALLAAAVAAGASDLHLEPGAAGYRLRLRCDGALRGLEPPPGGPPWEQVVARLKVLGGMNLAQRLQPQDGHFTGTYGGHLVDFRVAVAPAMDGEAATVRVLDRDRARLGYEDLGLAPEDRALVDAALERPSGLVLVSGPVGSGKTTTLYALVERLVAGGRSVLSIEDPVEARLDGVVQMGVNERAGFTFAAGLKAAVRHAPDVLVVGEVRDPETARAAVQAAALGHLVLATVHAEAADLAVERLLHLGVERYELAVGVSLVVAQRLVRRAPEGRGRLALFSVLVPEEGLRRQVLEGAGRLAAGGLQGLERDGARKVAAGLTTTDEVRRVLGAPRCPGGRRAAGEGQTKVWDIGEVSA